MSEMKDYENLSQKAVGVVVTAVIGVVAIIGEGVIKKIGEEYDKIETERRLKKENGRSKLGKFIHKKEREAAQRDYDKCHKHK